MTGSHPNGKAERHRCHLDWGMAGTRMAAERGDILVIVDTLSFSTSVITAVHHGGLVFPCAEGEDPLFLAKQVDSEVAVRRAEVPANGRFSLSPLTYVNIEPGTRVVLPSPNGGTCCRLAGEAPQVFIGALVNAKAVAGIVSGLMAAPQHAVTIIACGERDSARTEEAGIRFAIEDYLGAGAILCHLGCEKSVEAELAELAFRSSSDAIEEILWECESGRELREMGFAEDVRFAARLDLFHTVPMLSNGSFVSVL